MGQLETKHVLEYKIQIEKWYRELNAKKRDSHITKFNYKLINKLKWHTELVITRIEK